MEPRDLLLNILVSYKVLYRYMHIRHDVHVTCYNAMA